jgi:hypothetical protein
VTGETPAAHLTRLRITFPGWSLWRGRQTGEFWAAPPSPHPHHGLIHAPDLAALEAKIIQAERGSRRR